MASYYRATLLTSRESRAPKNRELTPTVDLGVLGYSGSWARTGSGELGQQTGPTVAQASDRLAA